MRFGRRPSRESRLWYPEVRLGAPEGRESPVEGPNEAGSGRQEPSEPDQPGPARSEASTQILAEVVRVERLMPIASGVCQETTYIL